MCSHTTYAVIENEYENNPNARSQGEAHKCYEKNTKDPTYDVSLALEYG